MKVQVDSNSYLTGAYCKVGNLDGAIEIPSLPEDKEVFYPAYAVVSEEVEKIIPSQKLVMKTREIEVPVFDEFGNDSGKTKIVEEDYEEYEDASTTVTVTEYHYLLDTAKKQAIQNEIDSPTPVEPGETMEDKVSRLENLLDTMGLDILMLQNVSTSEE